MHGSPRQYKRRENWQLRQVSNVSCDAQILSQNGGETPSNLEYGRTTNPGAIPQVKVRQSIKLAERPDVRTDRLADNTHSHNSATC